MTSIPDVYTCTHCGRENRRIDPRPLHKPELRCWYCNNSGPGSIPGDGFAEFGSKSLLTKDDQFTPDGAISSLTLDPASVVALSPSTGSVTLDGPAEDGGAVIDLASSDELKATVPATVTVSAGETGADFVVTTLVAGSSDITATYRGTVKTAALTVTGALKKPSKSDS